MSEPAPLSPPVSAPSTEKVPPFVQVIKTTASCQVQHNLIDPWLALALLEMGKQALLDGMKPQLIKPGGNGMSGLIHKMGRG